MNQAPDSNLWLFLEMLAKRRGLIFTLVLMITLAAVVISLVMPKWYTATGLLLPPPDENFRGGLAQLGEVALYTGGIRLPGLVTPNDVYARMLRSRRISDKIIAQFDLGEVYQTEGMSALYLLLEEHTKIEVTEEGMLSIAVEDRDPQQAAAMATAYMNELIELNRQLLSSTAREKREFIEARLGEVKDQLDSARTQLEAFQLDNRAVDLDEQARLALGRAVGLKVRQAGLELDISMAQRTLGEAHPDLNKLQRRLELIDEQLKKLEWGNGDDSSFFSLPVAAVPGLKGRYESFYAQVRVSEELHSLLLELFEQARIQEQEDSPTIAVLDWPAVPDLRSRPRRTIIVLTTFVFSLIMAVLLAAYLEYLKRLKVNHPGDYQRYMLFVGAFFGWLPGVRRKPDRQR